MNKFFLIAVLLITFSFDQSFGGTFSYDSTGITKKAGKTFIIHVVEQGETLYSLSRRYNVDVDLIGQENPEAAAGLKIGQKVLVPVAEKKSVPKDAHVHVVKGGETLYSLARVYGVTTADLKRWNNLADNNIAIGDEIIIKKSDNSSTSATVQAADNPAPVKTAAKNGKTHTVQPSETLFSISRMYNVRVPDIKKWNNLPSNEISIGQELVVGQGSAQATTVTTSSNSSLLPYEETPENTQEDEEEKINTDVVTSSSNNEIYSVDEEEDAKETYENKKVVQNGFAEVIEGRNETKKYLALHRSAPVGTIMQVRNEMNNQTVFVRVVGTIPSTDNNNNLIIKISKKAFDRLGAVDSKFPVELSYIP